jgi:hypothetical protein
VSILNKQFTIGLRMHCMHVRSLFHKQDVANNFLKEGPINLPFDHVMHTAHVYIQLCVVHSIYLYQQPRAWAIAY